MLIHVYLQNEFYSHQLKDKFVGRFCSVAEENVHFNAFEFGSLKFGIRYLWYLIKNRFKKAEIILLDLFKSKMLNTYASCNALDDKSY